MATTLTTKPQKPNEPEKKPKKQKPVPERNSLAEWIVTFLLLIFGTSLVAQPFVIPTQSMHNTLLTGDHLIVDKIAYAPAGGLFRFLLPYEEVKRGDIIVFRHPILLQEDYVKRVIGVPGDHIKLIWNDAPCGRDGSGSPIQVDPKTGNRCDWDQVKFTDPRREVWINGHKVSEPYTYHMYGDHNPYRDDFPNGGLLMGSPSPGMTEDRANDMLTKYVKDGELVVPNGFYFAMGDNRENSLDSRYWGLVPRENITGKPTIIFWSYDADTEDLKDYTWHHFFDLLTHFFSKTRWSRTLNLVHGYPLK